MGSETASGESRFSRYVDSIISSYKIGREPKDIDVPGNATHYVIESGFCMQITFYDRMTRPDLAEVPASWRGRKIKIQI
jgi:hypothetical protein